MAATSTSALAEELRQALERLAGVYGARATDCIRAAAGASRWDPEWSAFHGTTAAHYARLLWRDVPLTVIDCRQLRAALEKEKYEGPLRDRLEALDRMVIHLPLLDREGLPAHLRNRRVIMRGPRSTPSPASRSYAFVGRVLPHVVHEAGEVRAAIVQQLRQANGRRRRRLVDPDQVMQVVRDTATRGHGYVDGGCVGPLYGYEASKTAVCGRLGTAGAVLLAFEAVSAGAPESDFRFSLGPDLVIPRAVVQALAHVAPSPDMATRAAPMNAHRIER